MSTPRKTAKPAASAPTGPKIVLVTTVRAFATTHRAEFLTDDVVRDLAERALFVHDARFENTLFKALPEKGEATEDAEFILDELEDFAAEHGDDLEALLGPGPAGRALEWGLHAEAAYADVVAQFQKDGFEVKDFPAGA